MVVIIDDDVVQQLSNCNILVHLGCNLCMAIVDWVSLENSSGQVNSRQNNTNLTNYELMVIWIGTELIDHKGIHTMSYTLAMKTSMDLVEFGGGQLDRKHYKHCTEMH